MTIEQEARDLLNDLCFERARLRPYGDCDCRETTTVIEAICRALEQRDAERQAHADFRQRVSDAMEIMRDGLRAVDFMELPRGRKVTFSDFIIPKPVDPLVEAICETWGYAGDGGHVAPKFAKHLRAACIKHGIPIPDKREEG